MVHWKDADTSYADTYRGTDFRQHPERYKIGKGQQGVLMAEPYKSEILPYWAFRTPAIAQESARKIYALFLDYLSQDDFVGADMAKKFLHMGYTRSRRYANHPTGQKYDVDATVLPQASDALTSDKAESARIFYPYWKAAREDTHYLELRDKHKEIENAYRLHSND